MHVFFGTAAPFFAARNQFELDDPLRAEFDRHRAIVPLKRRRHEDAFARLQRRKHFGHGDQLAKVGRADLFLAFAYQDEIHG